MQILPPYHRILLLTEGSLGVFSSKTAASLLRYRSRDIVGIVDSYAAGQDVRQSIPWSPSVPVLESIKESAGQKPDALFIGIAPVGGNLPERMRRHILDALRAGIDVVSGLHARLMQDPEFAGAARERNARIWDVREPLGPARIATAAARQARCVRVLTIGTDCNVGKMVAALEITAALRNRGYRAAFAATGQTGIMIAGKGIAIDAVVSDFAAGAAEELVLGEADADFCIVEGQGSVVHPGFSGVTLSLIHGVCPDAMVLVHHLGRTHYAAEPHPPLPEIGALVRHYEQAASFLHPARVIAVAVNAQNVDPILARDERAHLSRQLGLPMADPIVDGCEALVRAIVDCPATARLIGGAV